jgi:hypothetical protein
VETKLVLFSILLMNLVALRAFDKTYNARIDRLNNQTIVLAHETFYSGCVQGRQMSQSSYLEDCREITTFNALDLVLFVK